MRIFIANFIRQVCWDQTCKNATSHGPIAGYCSLQCSQRRGPVKLTFMLCKNVGCPNAVEWKTGSDFCSVICLP